VTSSADIGLLPYQAVGINHEIATPNKLFEYIQARLPLATSRLPMIEKIVSGSNIGGFVDYTSERSTADGLRDFIATTLPGIQPDALEAAARRWSWEREETALFEVVDAAMARRRP
jgi:glycosyltransferase involved in cell wall biosynthesis